MKLKNYKLILALVLLFVPAVVLAQTASQTGLDTAAGQAGFLTDPQKTDISVVIVRVINGFLAVLGMVFIYFIITAGFLWMTSGGNAEKVLAAKTTLKNAFLGILIIFISYALTAYVINSLKVSTGLAPATQEQQVTDPMEDMI